MDRWKQAVVSELWEIREDMDKMIIKDKVISKDVSERIMKVFSVLMAGEDILSIRIGNTYFEESAMKIFLDYVKENIPDFFSSKEEIMGLVCWVREYAFRMMYDMETSCIIDVFLKELFLSYLDEELKSDEDVVLIFMEVIDPMSKHTRSLCACPEIVGICDEIPHELLMDEKVFKILLEKIGPAMIYSEILTVEERLDDDIVYKLLDWYYQKRGVYLPDMKDVYVQRIREMHEIWVQTIKGVFEENEAARSIYDKDSERAEELFALVDIFLDIIEKAGKEYIYDGVSDKTIIGKRIIFERLLMNEDYAENESSSLTLFDDGFEYYRHDNFQKIMAPYEYQMVLFDAVVSNNPFPFEMGITGHSDDEAIDDEAAAENEDGLFCIPSYSATDVIPF